jgi:uncharacterized Zn finger protein
MGWYYGFKPYVPVAKRRAQAASYAARLAKNEKRQLAPIQIEGRAIASSFWGRAWCEHLERYSDYANRLPRGRTYVRNGSVIDLRIDRGNVQALVSGSDIYRVTIAIKTLSRPLWTKIKRDCGQSILSLIDLLQGRFDQGIMQRLSQREGGLFPQSSEIKMDCSCPDWAGMCKHVAATLYGVGARLDTAPELLFTLRSVDHLELVHQATGAENLERSLKTGTNETLAGSNLEELFGIELDQGAKSETKPRPSPRRKSESPKPARSKTRRIGPQVERSDKSSSPQTTKPRPIGRRRMSKAK